MFSNVSDKRICIGRSGSLKIYGQKTTVGAALSFIVIVIHVVIWFPPDLDPWVSDEWNESNK